MEKFFELILLLKMIIKTIYQLKKILSLILSVSPFSPSARLFNYDYEAPSQNLNGDLLLIQEDRMKNPHRYSNLRGQNYLNDEVFYL